MAWEAKITIKENDVVQVEKYDNGFLVNRFNTNVGTLVKALIGLIPESKVMDIIVDHEETETYFNYFFEEYVSEESLAKLISSLLLQIENKDNKLIKTFLQVIAKNYDISREDEKTLNAFLNLLLKRVRVLNDNATYLELLMTLIEKSSITTVPHEMLNPLMKELLERIKIEEQKETIHSMFETLVKKADKEWLRAIVTQYEDANVMKSPVLPKNCVFYQEWLSGKKVVAIELQKHRRDQVYHRRLFTNVGFPKLLFVFHVMGTIAKAQIFAVKDTVIKEKTKLYRYPFSNVFNDFSACWPDLRKIPIHDITQLATLPELFLSSPNNDHLFTGKNLAEVFALLQDKDFDDTTLVYTGYTLGEYFGLKNRFEEKLPDEEVNVEFEDIHNNELELEAV